jgi:thiamine biosynthesis lipoprotein
VLWQRARPLLGTLVSIYVRTPEVTSLVDADVRVAMEAAFDVIAHIGRVMSAHHPESDLARLSRATPASDLTLDPHTVAVLTCAQHWQRVSGGAFDPSTAAVRLLQKGWRPGLSMTTPSSGVGLQALRVLSATSVRVDHALCLDLGGIAKGYAVDQAVAVLTQHGITSALVNAGGDMRAMGPHVWRLDVRHADRSVRDRQMCGLRGLCHAAVATSVAGVNNPEFVASIASMRRSTAWQSATVQAHDCLTADVLTKWALQSSRVCPSLTTNLRKHGARMWRNL